MKPTYEDVDEFCSALVAADNTPEGVTPDAVRAALEAYTPRLIERLASQMTWDETLLDEIGLTQQQTRDLADWLRTQEGK